MGLRMYNKRIVMVNQIKTLVDLKFISTLKPVKYLFISASMTEFHKCGKRIQSKSIQVSTQILPF